MTIEEMEKMEERLLRDDIPYWVLKKDAATLLSEVKRLEHELEISEGAVSYLQTDIEILKRGIEKIKLAGHNNDCLFCAKKTFKLLNCWRTNETTKSVGDVDIENCYSPTVVTVQKRMGMDQYERIGIKRPMSKRSMPSG